MMRVFISALLAFAAGFIVARSSVSAPSNKEAVGPISECRRERAQITALEAELIQLRAHDGSQETAAAERPPADPTPTEVPSGVTPPRAAPVEKSSADNAISWRISAIEKFLPLSEDQRDRLNRKFAAEQGAPSGGDAGTESLEDILGAESARFYRQQVQGAFKRAAEESLDKDVVWIARQLNLSAEQEASVRSAYTAIEDEIDQGQGDQDQSTHRSGQDRVKAMIEEDRRRQQLRADRMRELLTDDQYQAFMRLQSESSTSDLPIFHGPN